MPERLIKRRGPRLKRDLAEIRVDFCSRPVSVRMLTVIRDGKSQRVLRFAPWYSRHGLEVTFEEVYRWLVRYSSGNLLEDLALEWELKSQAAPPSTLPVPCQNPGCSQVVVVGSPQRCEFCGHGVKEAA